MNSYDIRNESTIPVQQSNLPTNNIPQQYPANAFPQQYTTVTTYPAGVNPNQPLPYPLGNQPQQQFTTVTTYPLGVNPNQPVSYYPVQAPTPVVFQEVPTPVFIQEKPVPVVIQETPAPVVIQETAAPVVIQETPAPVVIQQTPAPVEEIPLEIEEISAPTKEKPFLEKARDTLHEAGEKMGPYVGIAKDTLHEAGEKMGPYVGIAKDTLHQAGETLGLVKPAQNIEGPLSEIQEVRVEMGKTKMEQPFQKPLTERAKESINQTSVKVAPYTEKAKEILHQTGETIGIVKPAQNIEGPLSEIQEVRVEMGKTKMEQPYQKSFAEIAAETWNEAGVMIGPYAEMAKDTFYEAKDTLHEVGEKIGIVYPHQKIQGPLAEIQDIRKSKGQPRMEQPLWKPVDEMTYTDKTRETFYEAKDTLNEVSLKIEPFAEMAKDTLHEVGEKIGIVYPHQKIGGPLAEIQDIRKSKGQPRMEQPLWKPVDEMPLTDKTRETFYEAKDTLNEVGQKMEPYAERAKDTLHEVGVKAKESLHQAGEKVGNLVKPSETVEAIPVDLQGLNVGVGVQPVQKPLVNETLVQTSATIEKDQGTLFTTEEIIAIVNPTHNHGGEGQVEVQYEVEEIIDQPVLHKPLTGSAVWNEAGENIELGKQMGFINNAQNIEGPLIPHVSDIQENIGLQQQQHPVMNANEKMELFAEKARQKMARFSDQVGLTNTTGYPAGVQNWQQGQNWEAGAQNYQQGGAQNLQQGSAQNWQQGGAQNLQQGSAQNWQQGGAQNYQQGGAQNYQQGGAQNYQQGQNWESENPKRGPGFEDARMTKVTENIVETQTTKTLPA